jgi:hypothetical protein
LAAQAFTVCPGKPFPDTLHITPHHTMSTEPEQSGLIALARDIDEVFNRICDDIESHIKDFKRNHDKIEFFLKDLDHAAEMREVGRHSRSRVRQQLYEDGTQANPYR